MKTLLSTLAIVAISFSAPALAQADDADFLHALEGSWSGGGPIRLSPRSSPVNVSCKLDGTAAQTTLSLNGTCTGMVLFSRRIGAELRAENGGFVGSYVGSQRGTASLTGHREGRALDLALQWPNHPVASMNLSSPSDGRMVLTTIEEHPETGERVVTAELELLRQ